MRNMFLAAVTAGLANVGAQASAAAIWTFQFDVFATGTRQTVTTESINNGTAPPTIAVAQFFSFTRRFEAFTSSTNISSAVFQGRGDPLGLTDEALVRGTFDLSGLGENFTYMGGDRCLAPGCDLVVQLSAPTFRAIFLSSEGGPAPVPEPATWAMMMLGFGGVGYAMRRRPAQRARIRFA